MTDKEFKELEERLRTRKERMAKVKADAEPLRIEAEKAKAEYEAAIGTAGEDILRYIWSVKAGEYYDAMKLYYDIQACVA